MPPRFLVLLIGLALAPLPSLPAQGDGSDMLGDVVAAGELDNIHQRIQAKVQAGKRTAEALAPEIAKLDECIALFADDKDMAVEFAFTKAMVYADVIKNLDKGRELLRAVKRDYPDSHYAKQIDDIIAKLEKPAKSEDVNTELRPLLEKIKAKASEGAKTPDAFAPEIAQLDKLIAKYSRSNPEAAATVALQKAAIYFEMIKDHPKTRELLLELQKNYPDSTAAKTAQRWLLFVTPPSPPQTTATPGKPQK